jgi:NADPH2:quinone reductase
MKAIRVTEFGAPEVLRIADAALPTPAEGEVRVRLRAAGVNPVETYIRSGVYAGLLPELPYTPGTDGAGDVDAVGPGISRLAPGDRVFVAGAVARRVTGTYAEYAVIDEQAVFPLPGEMSYSQGAGLGTPGLTACQALFRRAKLMPGETVLIHGASGGVGSLAVQLARRHGAIVFGTAGSATGLELLTALGAHKAFDHTSPDYTDQIRAATGGRGLDVVIEMLANVNLARDLELVADFGRVAVVGNRGSLDFNPRLAMLRDASVLGVMLKNMPRADFEANMHTLAAALEGGLRVVVAASYPLEHASQAHVDILAEKGSHGKRILTM